MHKPFPAFIRVSFPALRYWQTLSFGIFLLCAPQAVAQQTNIQSTIQSYSPMVLKGASKAANLFRKRSGDQRTSGSAPSGIAPLPALIPPPPPYLPTSNQSSNREEERDVSIATNKPLHVSTPVVSLSFNVQVQPMTSGRDGVFDIDIPDACIEDVNGALVEKLNIVKTDVGFTFSAPSGSFKAQLIPSSDFHTGTINIAGADHKYRLSNVGSDKYTLQLMAGY